MSAYVRGRLEGGAVGLGEFDRQPCLATLRQWLGTSAENAGRAGQIDDDPRLAGGKEPEAIGGDEPGGRRIHRLLGMSAGARFGRAAADLRVELKIDRRQVDDHAVRLGEHEGVGVDRMRKIEGQGRTVAAILKMGGIGDRRLCLRRGLRRHGQDKSPAARNAAASGVRPPCPEACGQRDHQKSQAQASAARRTPAARVRAGPAFRD